MKQNVMWNVADFSNLEATGDLVCNCSASIELLSGSESNTFHMLDPFKNRTLLKRESLVEKSENRIN